MCIKKLSKGLIFWWSERPLRKKVEEVSWVAAIIAFVILGIQFLGFK